MTKARIQLDKALSLPVAATTGTDCDVVKNGLVAGYPFDGDVKDYRGNGNHGNPVGISYVPDKVGNALRLYRNSNSYVLIPNPAQKFDSEYTITGWFSINSDTGGVPVLKTSANDSGGGRSGWHCWGFGLISPCTHHTQVCVSNKIIFSRSYTDARNKKTFYPKSLNFDSDAT